MSSARYYGDSTIYDSTPSAQQLSAGSRAGKENLMKDVVPGYAQASQISSKGSLDYMSEREFADYEMREAHKLGLEADSSKYQRAYADLVKTGLNPRLLLSSGADTNSLSASSGYSYSQSDNKSESKSNSFSTSALIVGLILAAAKLLS